MKVRAVVCAGLFLFFSVALQGCDFGEPEKANDGLEQDAEVVEQDVKEDAKKVEKVVKKDEDELEGIKPKKKASAHCKGGHFHCDGGWKEWCGRMKKKCSRKDCAPICSWSCDSPKCSQECGPVCNPPACSTRCKGFNTESCKMKCGKPNCKVVCPKHFCPGEDCAACKTECGKPACRMECGNDLQPCRHVCAEPVCKWECKNPNLCPKPKCEMKCKKIPECAATHGSFSTVPPLEPGETEILTVDAPSGSPAPAPASFLQGQAGSMRVNFTAMGEDHSVHAGHVTLAMVQEEVVEEDSWTREVTEVGGQVTEREASCSKGIFRCQGNDSWCSEQKRHLCEDGKTELSLRKAQSQGHLKA